MSTLLLYSDGGITPGAVLGQGATGGTGALVAVEGAGPGGTPLVLAESSAFHDGPTTNQVMELKAAQHVIVLARTVLARFPKLASLPIVLCSDSAYVVNCLASPSPWWVNWVLKSGWKNSVGKPVENVLHWRSLLAEVRGVHDTLAGRLGPSPWKRLNEDDGAMVKAAYHGLRVTFRKVKGHSTDALNNRADELATLGKNGGSSTVFLNDNLANR
jgi:ribonuclease HI